MLSRRHLRIKVLQALYAFFQSHSDDLGLGEKNMLKSIDRLYELYIHHLSFLIELLHFTTTRIEDARNKFFPTEEDLNPSLRFIENSFIKQLAENKDYIKKSSALKINWADEQNLLRDVYNKLKESEFYAAYMSKDTVTYQDDKEIISRIVSDIFEPHEIMQQYYSDRSIYWADGDYELSLYMVLKTIKYYKENWISGHLLPDAIKPDFDGNNDDRKFIQELFRKTVLNSEENEGLIETRAQNWELERIAVMDMIILKMAITEILEFSSIPLKVSMNEYIEISKYYSSGKSRIFINGILDKLIAQFKADDKIHKTGRGLIE